MTLKDFHKGQMVFVKEVLYRNPEPIIWEVPVCSVGRKYVTVQLHNWKKVKFDATDNFREVTDFTPKLSLYLSREDIERERIRNEKIEEAEKAFRHNYIILRQLSNFDLDALLAIVRKYVK